MTTDGNRTIAEIVERAPGVLDAAYAAELAAPRDDQGTAALRQDGSRDQAQARRMPTEDSVARLFVGRHWESWRFDQTTSTWYEWVGTHWLQDRNSRVVERVRDLTRELALGLPPALRREVERRRFIMAVERLALRDERYAVTSDVWDASKWLLGTPGGTLDLHTGSLRASMPADNITKLKAVAPALEPDRPSWLKFMSEVTNGNPDFQRFFQQWCGYCLTGSTREHSLLFAFGQGGRGKGTFITTATNILRDYATAAPIETFTDSHAERHPTELARLKGARPVTASDTEQGRAWAEAKLKMLTGGDWIAARFTRGDFFEFVPTFKLTIIGNHRPSLRSVGDAERRRFKLAPFDFKPAVPDRHLVDCLAGEAAGIQTWMVNGCLDWQSNGLVLSDIVTDATEGYFESQDTFGAWLDADVEHNPVSSFGFETSAALYASWRSYAGRIGEREGTMKAFVEKLQSRGFRPHRTNSARGFRGVKLRTPASTASSEDDHDF